MQTLTTGLDSLTGFRARALSEIPLLGRSRELSKLQAAVASGSPALIEGSPGHGKTRLLLELKQSLSVINVDALYIPFSPPLHAFLLDFANKLFLDTGTESSIALRGAIWKALESNPRVLLLDDVGNAGPMFFRFFDRIQAVKGNVLVGTALQLQATGALHRVFWNPQMNVTLHALNKQDAERLIESAIKTFLEGCSIAPDFAARIAQAARGNPGRIVDLCIRATDKAYWDKQERIRFGALLMDSVAGSLP